MNSNSPWLPALPSLSDTALSYFLGETTTQNLPLLLAESASRLASNFAIRYCELSGNGLRKLVGLEEKELRTLLQEVMACASTANDGLVFAACIHIVAAAANYNRHWLR